MKLARGRQDLIPESIFNVVAKLTQAAPTDQRHRGVVGHGDEDSVVGPHQFRGALERFRELDIPKAWAVLPELHLATRAGIVFEELGNVDKDHAYGRDKKNPPMGGTSQYRRCRTEPSICQ